MFFERARTRRVIPIFSCGVATHLQVLTRFAIGKQAFRALKPKAKKKKEIKRHKANHKTREKHTREMITMLYTVQCPNNSELKIIFFTIRFS